jgi:CHAT domain-containing protein
LETLEKTRRAGLRLAEAQTLNSLGVFYHQAGDYEAARKVYEEALQLMRTMQHRVGEATTLGHLAAVWDAREDIEQALRYYYQALAIQQQVGHRPGQVATLRQIANIYSAAGAYPLGLEVLRQALSVSGAMQHRYGEGAILRALGEGYEERGDAHESGSDVQQQRDEYAKALEHYQTARDKFRIVGYLTSEAEALTDLSRVYRKQGDYRQAHATAQELSTLSTDASYTAGEATALAARSATWLAQGGERELRQALEANRQALALDQRIAFSAGQRRDYLNLGNIYEAQRQPEPALIAYTQALAAARAQQSRLDELQPLYLIAGLEQQRNHLLEAQRQMMLAIERVESLRARLPGPELRTALGATKHRYYQRYIDILMQLHQQFPERGYDAQALHMSEQARARSLLDLLQEARVDIRQGIDSTLLTQEEQLLRQLDHLELARLAGPQTSKAPAAMPDIEAQTQQLQQQYAQLQTQLRLQSPHYDMLRRPAPLTVAALQQQVLDEHTMLLAYALGPERSYVWLVSQTGLTSYVLPREKDIENAARAWYQSFAKPQDRALTSLTFAQAAQQLSTMLLRDAAAHLRTQRLVIVSEGALQYIPFAALPLPGHTEPLLATYEVVHLPSASTLAVLRQTTRGRMAAPKTAVILADPVFDKADQRVRPPQGATEVLSSASPQTPRGIVVYAPLLQLPEPPTALPHTATEAKNIQALVSGDRVDVRLGFDANRAYATSPHLAQYQIVHFATHGRLDRSEPARSAVVLSLVNAQGEAENGYLSLRDIYKLRLAANLVVLSACETGLGKDFKGEGMVGLTRGFMYAGAPRVVVSLWQVDDEETAVLMTQFYQQMLQHGRTPAAALREAQLSMWREGKALYYWAPFILQGEWQ